MAPESRRRRSTESSATSESSFLHPRKRIPLSPKLPRSFYSRPTLDVAPDLLGRYIVRVIGGRTLVGKIVEVEAYLGTRDPASHAYRGITKRNAVMFGKAGYLYVYFTYGMHFCANVVTDAEETAGAVLIRGVEPLGGISVMKHNRGRRERGDAARNLTNGPARFCEAFGIRRKENGTDLLGSRIYLAKGERVPRSAVGRSTRIGIRAAASKPWRFFVKNNPWVSR